MVPAMAKQETKQPFTGFPKGGVEFFQTLSVRQDRAWFHAHKTDYQQLWEAPMHAFLDAVQAKTATLFPETKKTKSKVFRIYRDVRFSKDKSPFKTSISGVIPLYQGGMMERVGYYFELGPTPFVAAGRWMMDPPTLKRFRKAVADERTGPPFAAAVEKAVAKGFVVSSEQQLSRVPKPWTKEHPREALLRQKGFTFTLPNPSFALLHSPRLVDWAVTHLKDIAPVMKWVERAARGKKPTFK
jgi:uncharacterized protein (TIGR02453 family)